MIGLFVLKWLVSQADFKITSYTKNSGSEQLLGHVKSVSCQTAITLDLPKEAVDFAFYSLKLL